MALSTGMQIPLATLHTMTDDGIKDIETTAYFQNRKIVVFVVPGAFTPTCSAQHLPSYRDNFDALMAAGIDTIACLSVNDVFVLKAWAVSENVYGRIDMLADMRGAFCEALGILTDMGDVIGQRAKRCAFVVDNATITHSFIEEPKQFEVSSAEHILAALNS